MYIEIEVNGTFTAISQLEFSPQKAPHSKIHSQFFCKFLILAVLGRCRFLNLMQCMVFQPVIECKSVFVCSGL